MDPNHYFDFSYGLDGVVTPEYTCFEYDKWVSYEEAIDMIVAPLDKSAFIYETVVLKQELENSSYDQRIYEAVLKKYLKSHILLNSLEIVSWSDVQKYHATRYKKENIVAVDDDFHILYEGSPLLKKKSEETLEKIIDEFSFEDDDYFLLLYKNYNAKIYRKLYFLFWMFSFYSTYSQRWKNCEYYYLEPYFNRYATHCWILFPKLDYQKMALDFFLAGKQYIIRMISEGYFKERFFLNKYFFSIPFDRKEVLHLYRNYTFEDYLSEIDAFL